MKKILATAFSFVALLALIVLPAVSVGAQSVATWPNIAGTWYCISNIRSDSLDGAYTYTYKSATLVIVDNTALSRGTIQTCSITLADGTATSLTGFVGKGSNPSFQLGGHSADLTVLINGHIRSINGIAVTLAANLDGRENHSGGVFGQDTGGGTEAWTSVSGEPNGGSVAVLLTQGAAAASTYVDLLPPLKIPASMLTTINSSKYGLWFNQQTGTEGGPQLELRFLAPGNDDPNGEGHVDVTILQPTTGTGQWVDRTFNGDSLCVAYGNDPIDGTAFAITTPTKLSAIVAAINNTAEMKAGAGATINKWVLSRTRVELYDAGVRTCYIDDVTVGGQNFTFEPSRLNGSFTAIKQ